MGLTYTEAAGFILAPPMMMKIASRQGSQTLEGDRRLPFYTYWGPIVKGWVLQ